MPCDPYIISCSIDRLTDAISNQGPSVIQLWMVVLSGLSVLASTFVGVAAWRTSARATRIAEAALASEDARDEDRYRGTITEAMARVILALADHASETSDWIVDAKAIEAGALPGRDPDTLPYPPKPSLSPVMAQLEAARLLARGPDRDLLALVNRFQLVVHEGPIHLRVTRLGRLIAAIRQWRDGTTSSEETETALKAAMVQMTADDA